MQEEVNERIVALAVNAEKFTGKVMIEAIKAYLNQVGRKKAAIKAQREIGKKNSEHGKMTVQDLVGQGQGATNIEIKDKDIHIFEGIARRYNVDFAVQKDKTGEVPRYLVYFKAKDTDVIAQAFREYVHETSKKKTKVSLKKKLEEAKKVVAKNKDKTRELSLHKKREAPSL